MKRIGFAVCLAACLLNGVVLADVLVDTGPGSTSSVGSQSLFNNGGDSFQFLAARFTLTEGAVLESVEAWMKPFGTGGDLNVRILADGPVPGSLIFSKTYTIGDRFVAGWDVFADYTVALPAGSYWLAFEPVAGSGMQHGMPTGAPTPLDAYAYFGGGNPGYIAYGTNPGLGIRISGATNQDAPMGTATRVIVEVQLGSDHDEIKGGQGEVETLRFYWTNSAFAMARGTVDVDALEAGAFADQNIESQSASRAVSFRTFVNNSAGPVEFKVNASLGGMFREARFDLPPGYLVVTGGVYVLDSTLFQDTVAASGLPVEEFLLGGDSLSATAGGTLRVGLDTLFPVAARLGSDTVMDNTPLLEVPQSYPLETGLVTVGPGENFTLMFDVSALATGNGAGTTDFLSTLDPDPDLFTDVNDNPITDFEALGAGLSIGEATALLWEEGASDEAAWTSASGASLYRVYRGTLADLPGLLDASPDACLKLETGSTQSGAVITEDPGLVPGGIYWYLVVGSDGAGEGTPGPASGGERVLDPSGACP